MTEPFGSMSVVRSWLSVVKERKLSFFVGAGFIPAQRTFYKPSKPFAGLFCEPQWTADPPDADDLTIRSFTALIHLLIIILDRSNL